MFLFCYFPDKEGKGLTLNYQTKNRLVAYTKAAVLGKYSPEVCPDVGFLDVVGNDRK